MEAMRWLCLLVLLLVSAFSRPVLADIDPSQLPASISVVGPDPVGTISVPRLDDSPLFGSSGYYYDGGSWAVFGFPVDGSDGGVDVLMMYGTPDMGSGDAVGTYDGATWAGVPDGWSMSVPEPAGVGGVAGFFSLWLGRRCRRPGRA